MAEAIPIIGTIAAFAAIGLLGPIGPFVALAITIGTGLLTQALIKKPSLGARTQTLNETLTSRKLPFGEMVMGGKFSFYESTEGGHFHHMIITLGDAPLAPWAGIDIVWLDDIPIFNSQMDAGGNVIHGKFRDEARIKKHLGGPGQVADANLIAEIGRLDEDFKGVGVAYVYIRLNWDADLFPNGLPRVRVWARTNTVFDTRDSVRRYTPNAALILREYLTVPEVGLGYDADDINDTITNSAANICDEIVNALPIGHAVVNVDIGNDELDLAVTGTGAPVRIETGDRVEIFIASGGAAPGGLATGTSYFAIVERLVGENWGSGNERIISLDPADYIGDGATAISAGNVDTKHRDGDPLVFIIPGIKLATTYANALDRVAINITTAGTGRHLVIKTGEPRYAAAGIIDSAVIPSGNIAGILTAMAGKLIWAGGVFHITPAAWQTPITPTFDESDLWGPLVTRTRHGRRERFNAVRGVLATQLAVGEVTDYPPVIDQTAVTNDGGFKIWRTIDLHWTSRIATAQRLVKIALAKHRREIRQEFPTGPKGFRAIPGTVIQVSNTRRSFTNKTMEVLEQADLQVGSEGRDSPPLQGVTMKLAELDSTAFDFTASADETVMTPIATPLGGNPLLIEPPTALVLTSGDSELFIKADGTVVSRINVAWTMADFFADRTEVQFKRSAASEWNAVGLIQRDQTSVQIWDVEDGISYDVRVRSISNIGVISDWLTGTHTVIGKTNSPPDVATFSITRMADGTRRFTWTATPPADVTSGGGFKLRFVSGFGGVWSGMSELHTGLLAVSPFETNELAAGSYTFALKMIDSSGNESVNAVIIEATLGDPRLRNVLLTRDERALGWPGVKVDCFVNYENILEAEGAQTWADLPATWSALPDSWLTIVDSKSPITYTTPTMDLGSDVTFAPLVSVDPNATVTMQVGTDADGAPVGAFVALESVTKRYIKIKVVESSTDPFIQSIVTLIDAETQVEDYEDIDTSAATAGLFERIATGHFKLATRGNTGSIISVTIRAFQNAGSGWTWDLLSKTTTITGNSEPAAEFKIYQNGTLTDATVDVEIKGPRK